MGRIPTVLKGRRYLGIMYKNVLATSPKLLRQLTTIVMRLVLDLKCCDFKSILFKYQDKKISANFRFFFYLTSQVLKFTFSIIILFFVYISVGYATTQRQTIVLENGFCFIHLPHVPCFKPSVCVVFS